MSQEMRSKDGRYLFAVQDDGPTGDQDGNVVVYDTHRPPPNHVWDRWSYEAGLAPLGGDERPGGPLPVPAPERSPTAPWQPPTGLLGGIEEHATSLAVRPRPSREEIAGFLPPAAGGFLFPAPYGTQGVRLTAPGDRVGDVRPVGYSYWSNVNAHAGQSRLLVLLGRVHGPAVVLAVDKATLAVAPVAEVPLAGTGEGWYWSMHDAHVLYLHDGTRLLRWRIGGDLETVFDVRNFFGDDAHITQTHSSADGRVHSATLQDAGWRARGALVYGPDAAVRHWPARGAYDECQVDKSGRWLLVKEGADNGVLDLAGDGEEWRLTDAAGALGHSDMGHGYAVGEDDHAAEPGAFRLWRYGHDGPQDGGLVYHMTDWVTMARHVSHGNAPTPFVIVSSAHRRADVPRANEIVRAPLDGSLRCTALAPNLCDLDAPGGGEDYWKTPRANVDAPGEWACWSANCGTDRLDAFLVRVG